MTEPRRILVVDDEEIVRRALMTALTKRGGHRVDCAPDGEQALEMLRANHYHLVISDLNMPSLDGIRLLRRIRRDYPHLPVIIFTGYGTLDDAIEVLRLGAANFLRKPFDLGQIRITVERVLAMESQVQQRRQAFQYCRSSCQHFRLPASMDLKPGVVSLLTESLEERGVCCLADVRNIASALDEVITNAIVYGGMQLPSGIRNHDPEGFATRLEQWSASPPQPMPELDIVAEFLPGEVSYKVTDPGPGFDFQAALDLASTEAVMMKDKGRGLLLARCFMDEVRFAAPGNSVTLVKRAAASTDQSQ